MSEHNVSFELDVKDLVSFLYFLEEIGFQIEEKEFRRLADGTVDGILELHTEEGEVGFLVVKFIDNFSPDSEKLFKLKEETISMDHEKWYRDGYWAVPVEPVKLFLDPSYAELGLIISLYEDDYPTESALEAYKYYLAKNSAN